MYPGVYDQDSRSLFQKIENLFPLNNFSLLWLIGTQQYVWVAYVQMQLGIATQVSVIKVKVTVAKRRNSVSAQ